MVFLAMVRAKGLSYRKSRKAAVTGNLKHVHWLLMAICVVRQNRGLRDMPETFQWLLHFFQRVQFAHVSFCLNEHPWVFGKESESQDAVYVQCPISHPAKLNLAKSVTADKCFLIQSELNDLKQFDLEPGQPLPTAIGSPRVSPRQAMSSPPVASRPESNWQAIAAQGVVTPDDLIPSSRVGAAQDSPPIQPGGQPASSSASPPQFVPPAPVPVKAWPSKAPTGAPPSSGVVAAPKVPPPKTPPLSPPPLASPLPSASSSGVAAALVSAPAQTPSIPPVLAPQLPSSSAAVAAPEFGQPVWLEFHQSMTQNEICAFGVQIWLCKFKGNEVLCSFPERGHFGASPVVVYLHGAAAGTPLDKLSKKELKAHRNVQCHWSSSFLETISKTIWMCPLCNSTTKKSWKMPPEAWVLDFIQNVSSSGYDLGCSSSGPTLHLVGHSRGAWWGSVIAGLTPKLWASVWLVGGYPSVMNYEDEGTSNANNLCMCQGCVWVIGSDFDNASPAEAYKTWYAILEQHPNTNLHGIRLPAELRISHNDLGFLCWGVPPNSALNQYNEEFHKLFRWQ